MKVRDMKDNINMLEKMTGLFSFWYDHYTLPIKKQDCKSLENVCFNMCFNLVKIVYSFLKTKIENLLL